MRKPIRKAVLPVAGLGTRFLPATKTIPKEMLTVVDRPILQHVVDEARAAGVEDTLRRRGKLKELEGLLADLPKAGHASFTRQQAPLGLGHAVWCARELVGDEPFAVLLPDMVTMGGAMKSRCLSQCVDVYNKHGGNIIAVEAVPPEETHQYGIVAVGQDFGHDFEIKGMIEKPAKGTAPSNLIISGRYILQPEIFDILEHVEKGAGGEIQLTDGMIKLADAQAFHGVRFDGRTYDCGSKIGFLAANLAFALEREDLGPQLRAEMKKMGL